VKSQPGAGAMFGVLVPVATGQGEPAAAPVSEPERTRARVLCIEDEDSVLKALTGLLQRWGCETVAARSWEEAIAASSGFRPHLILADYHLGQNRTGLDLVGALRTRLGAPVAAAIVTADRSEAIRNEVRARRPAIPDQTRPADGVARAGAAGGSPGRGRIGPVLISAGNDHCAANCRLRGRRTR